MAFRQLKTPNLRVPATRGWCLKYVDDGVSAPKRQPTAQRAYEVEKKNGHIRTSALPVGLWVPIWFSLSKGPYRGLGHVAWAKNHGSWVEIHDSETATGSRPVYRSIAEVSRWFANHGISYKGWSLWVDGVQMVQEYTPKPAPSSGRKAAKGRATVIVSALNVRNKPDDKAAIAAVYKKGQSFTYDSYQVADGYVWLSYVSYSGVRRYIAEGPANGNPKDIYVRGGVSR